jgi:glycosyltransferase involved in cell wall biosynthesis
VIRCFHAYHTTFNPRSRLIIAGVFSVFERYFAALTHLVNELGLQHVHFAGHVSDAELIAYYELADLFLCCSEHEGFCVPLIEAFYKQVPVLAYAATAVPATMDGAGILFETKDPAYVASLMDAVLSNDDLQESVVQQQLDAVDRLQAKDFDRTLLGFVEEILSLPRQGAPRVAFDFWQQFDSLEQLEEFRRYRPSAYFALPEGPA